MSDYLFSQNLIIVLSALATLATYMFVKRLLSFKWNLKLTLIALVSTSAFLWAEIHIVATTFGLQDIPAAAYYLVALCDASLVLTALQWKHKKSRVISGLASFFSTLLLLALVVNNYYQYYPTLGSIFATYNRTGAAATITTARQHSKYNVSSIEGTYFGYGQNRGTVTTVNIPGTQSHLAAQDSYIYLPPAYSSATFSHVKFPVLVLLTGTPGIPSSWLQGGSLVNTMDNFAYHHEGITPIVVIADHSGSFTNDTECLNSAHGNAEIYVSADVPNYIRQHYRAADNPINWGIGGFSEGGMCAAMLTLEHQNIFRHFLDMSGEPYPYLNNGQETLSVLFSNSLVAQKRHNVDWLMQHQRISPDVTAQFAIGADDSKNLISQMKHTYHEATQRNLTASLEVLGHQGHSFSTWSRAYSDALPKLSYYLGATDCETTCSQ